MRTARALAMFTPIAAVAAIAAAPPEAAASGSSSPACTQYWTCVDSTYQELEQEYTGQLQACQAEIRAGSKGGCTAHQPNVGQAEAACGSKQHLSCKPTTVVADYIVLTLLYAPPGKGSSTNYGQGSSAGATMSFSSSQGVSTSLSATASASAAGFGASVTGTTSSGSSSSQGQSFTLSKTTTKTLSIGSHADTIDHGQDIFEIWIQPSFVLTQTGLHSQTVTLASVPMPASVLEISVNELLGKETPPAYKQQALSMLTRGDIQNILAMDPFVNAVGAIDTNRYVALSSDSSQLALDGPDNAGDETFSNGLSVSDSSTRASSSSETTTSSTGYSVKVDGGFDMAFVKLSASVGASKTWNWSYSTSFQTTTGTQQSASVNLTTSTVGFHDIIDVYEDTLFHTFTFRSETNGDGIPPNEPPSVSGQISRNGRPLANQAVIVQLPGGKLRRVFTNARGVYRVYRAGSGSARVVVNGQSVDVALSPRRTMTRDVRL